MSYFPFLILAAALFGDIGSHLKKASDKSGDHSFKNIDFLYMINLDQRPEKWERSIFQLQLYGIDPYRFSAVNGWELSLEDLDDVGLKFAPGMEGGFWGTCYPLYGAFEPSHEIIQTYGQTYFSHCMARGTIGIVLSHVSVLKDAYDSGYETIWVMEDDIEVLKDPRIVSDLIEKLDRSVGKGNWDVLFTDRDLRDANGFYSIVSWASKRPDYAAYTTGNDYTLNRAVNADFRQIGARYGAHSMVVRRSGMEKLLSYFLAHQVFLPYDIEYVMPKGIRLFTVLNNVVSNTPKAPSDNGGPNYLNKENR